MKVLLVTHYGDLYGANLSLCNLADTLQKRHDVDITVLCLSNEGEKLQSKLDKADISFYSYRFFNTTYSKSALQYIKAQINSCRNYVRLEMLDSFIRENKFDLIHSNTMATLVGAQLAVRHHIPHIWHLREFLEEDYDSSQVKNRFFSNTIKYTSCFIAISDAIREKYCTRLPKNKIVRIYNGIPMQWNSQMEQSNSSKTIFALVGVIREGKGTIEAIEAFISLCNKKYENIELWIIGGGMEQESNRYIHRIKEIVNQSVYSMQIKFWGYRNDISELLEQVNVGLICSKLEAFGRVTIEYMQKNVYVIGADSGGTSELIQDGITGALYKSGNIQSLEEKMGDYLDNRQEKEVIRKNAFEYSKCFSIDSCSDEIYKVYKSVIYGAY